MFFVGGSLTQVYKKLRKKKKKEKIIIMKLKGCKFSSAKFKNVRMD